MCIYSMHYFVRATVCYAMGEMCFSAAIEDRQLKFLVKIPIIYVHFVCPSVTLWGKCVFSAAIEDRKLKFLVKIPILYVQFVCLSVRP